MVGTWVVPVSSAASPPRRRLCSRRPTEMLPDSFEQLETALKTGLDISDDQAESLSGLDGDPLERFRDVWRRLEGDERATLLSRLGEASEENLVLDFGSIFHLGLDDPDPAVRELSYQL